MSIQHHEVKVAGMICRQCEDIICCGMNNVRGVVSCRASYWRETVALDYDSEWISPSELENHLSQIGYPARAKRQLLLMDANPPSASRTAGRFQLYPSPCCTSSRIWGLLWLSILYWTDDWDALCDHVRWNPTVTSQRKV